MKRNRIIIGIVLLLIIGLFFVIEYFSKTKEINNEIEINITKGQIIKSPLLIKGTVTGGKWVGFEGQVGRVELVQSNGLVLASAPLLTISDWTNLPTNFEAKLIFNSLEEKDLLLVFHNENPSGILENDRILNIPVKIK